MRDPRLITPETMQERLSAALRLFVGHGKPWSVPMLARAIDVPANTVDKWVYGTGMPCVWKLARLYAVLGAELSSCMLDMAGQAARPLSGYDQEACTYSVNASATGFTALIGKHLKDRILEPHELEEQRQMARQLRNDLDVFLQEGS